MSYVYLKYGDRLPSVAVAQKLLNSRAGTSLRPDGVYEKKTKAAVKLFQHQRGLPLFMTNFQRR